MKIIPAIPQDAQSLRDLFFAQLESSPSYISHGEIQMGIALSRFENDRHITEIAPDGKDKWMNYILTHINDDSFAEVWKAVDDEGRLLGFCVADIEDDGDAPFGVICDLLVNPLSRGGGVGGALLETAIAWLRERGVKDIYLESGKNNHPAHAFFEKRGFHHISQIFKLDNEK